MKLHLVAMATLLALPPLSHALAQGGVMPALPAGDTSEARSFSLGHGVGHKDNANTAPPAEAPQPVPAAPQRLPATSIMKTGSSIGTKE